MLICILQIYKEDLLDLLVPAQKRDKDQISIREDVSGGIKVAYLFIFGILISDQAVLSYFVVAVFFNRSISCSLKDDQFFSLFYFCINDHSTFNVYAD